MTRSIRTALFLLAAAAAVAPGGCSAAHHVDLADLEGEAIVAEKTAEVDRFRSGLVDPATAAPDSAKGRAQSAPVDVPETMSIDDSIRIASRYNRDFLRQREQFFLAALALGLTRRDFLKPVFAGTLSWGGADGRDVELSESTVLALSGTQFLPSGGRVTVSGDAAVGTDPERHQDSSASGSVVFSQPLLRGAGRAIAFEPLTQAERDLVYAARSFELFRQNFTISIVNQYYGLVQRKKSVANTKSQVDAAEFLLKQAEALHRLEQGTQADVLRAQQNHRNAQNALLDAQQDYDLAVDRFKIELGLPIDSAFDVGDDIPEPDDLELPRMGGAVTAALHNRLDLLTERERHEDVSRDVLLARNRLLPDLSLDASYTLFAGANSLRDLTVESDTVTFGLTLELPLDRKPERNAYRSALIALEQSRRELDQVEDRVILDVRDSLRRLHQVRQQIENDRLNVKTIERRRRRAYLDNVSGNGNNRDVVEASNDLTAALNSLNARFVDYLVARLQLQQQMGLLFVDKQGRIVD